jgi:hemoglobin/transferrin/lactoferrin receptor protein
MAVLSRRVHALLFGISATALMAPAAHAQTWLDAITVIATKTEEKVSEALAAVSTVRQEQMDQIMPQRTSDLFFGLPGVWYQQRADQPESSINIRGLQDFGRVAVVVDGARQNFQRSGHNANGSFFLEPELLAALDIARGPVSNIYGSGAIGGVASFRTKDADDILRPGEKWGAQAHFTAGSNQVQGLGSLFAAARVNPNVDVFLGGTYRSVDDYKDGHGNPVANSGFETGTGIGKLTIRPAEGHQIKLGAITYESSYKAGQQANPNAESTYDTRVRNNIFNARWTYSRPDDKLFDFDGNVYWTNTKQDQTKIGNGAFAVAGNPITGKVGDPRSFGITTKGFDLHNTTRLDAGDFRNALTYGGDMFRDDVDNVDNFGNGAVTTPNGTRTVGGAFAQWKMNYSTWLEVISAVRYDTYSLDGGGSHSEGDHVSPKITAGLTPVRGFTVYGTFAEGYRAPAVTETLVAGAHPPFAAGFPNLFTFLPNPDLKPEIGKTTEVGINLNYDNILTEGDKFRGKINVFRNKVTDYIDLATFGPPVIFAFCPAPIPGCPPVPIVNIPINDHAFAQYQNIANARIQGVEFEMNYDAGDWFLGVSGQRIRGKDLDTSDPLGTIPPDQVATTFGLRMLDRKLTAAVRWAAVSAKTANLIPDRNRDGVPDYVPTDSYNLVNVYLSYAPVPDVVASFSVENLLNAYYSPYLNTSTATVFPGPGITYKAGLKIRFGAT